MTGHKHDLVAKYSFKIAPSEVEFWIAFKKNFFRIVGFLEAETSVSGKAECYLAMDSSVSSMHREEDDKVSFLEWPPLRQLCKLYITVMTILVFIFSFTSSNLRTGQTSRSSFNKVNFAFVFVAG